MVSFSRRHLLWGASAASLTLLLSACGSKPQIKEPAEQLAQALSSLEVSGVKFSGTEATKAQESLTRKVRNMTGAEPTVTLASVDDSGETPRATLHWSWKIPGSPQKWEYDTTVNFSQDGDAWVPQWNPTVVHSNLDDSSGLALAVNRAVRGEILGANNTALVTLRPVVRVGIEKSPKMDAEVQEKSARQLAEVLEIDADAYVKQVKNGGENQFVEAIVLRQEAFKKLDKNKLNAIEGFFSSDSTKPLAPSAGFAPDILGSVWQATSDDIEKSEGAVSSGQTVGHGGLQERFNEQLQGSDGYSVYTGVLAENGDIDFDKTNAMNTTLTTVEAKNGSPLEITLNEKAQLRAVEILKDQDSPSAIVAIKVSTAEILVAANGEASEGFPTAFQAQYAPGSTFKIATSLALLRKGFTPDSQVNCSESVTVDGQTFKNASTYPASALGNQPLSVAVAQSSNTAFINERDKVSQQELHDAAAALGLGIEADLGVGTFFGSVPTEASEVEHAVSMIGQGKILVSPLAMATLAASVARGKVVAPVLVKNQQLSESKVSDTSLTAGESEQLKKLMRGVVTEGGLKNLQALSPDTAYGKTGTAEYGNDNPPKTHSWVIAVHEDIALALVVEDGDLGSITGAPIAQSMFESFSA